MLKGMFSKSFFVCFPIAICLSAVEIIAIRNGINGHGLLTYFSCMFFILGIVTGKKIWKKEVTKEPTND